MRPKGQRPPNDPQTKVDDSDRNIPEQLARDVLKATGIYDPEAIDDRVGYHAKTGTVEKLLERLERGHPEAWAKVERLDIFASDEPSDGLAS